MARCMKCGRSDKVMRCICQDCLAQAGWHPADQLPKLEERREVDPDEGDYIFTTSAPLLLWCPDKDPHQVVGRYLREECWAGFADRDGTPLHPTHWMEGPDDPEA